jgi:nicotinamidase-related amidase
MTKPALLIIDMCQDFFKEGRLKSSQKRLCEAVNALSTFFRRSGHPVIWVRQEFKEDLSDAFLSMRKDGTKITIADTEGAKLLSNLEIKSSDIEVIKKRYSAFFRTDLDQILEQLKIDSLVLAGVNTHACIRTAAVDGFQRDFEIILADEAIDSYDPQFHAESKRYLEGRVGSFMSNAEIFQRFAST